ncbi:MAG: NAD(P)H-quinone dehydrogenase [Actinobacteria bacterium]|nr:NAD(P)H-quinone dehydrogenase [Actinomycetota bacterium]
MRDNGAVVNKLGSKHRVVIIGGGPGGYEAARTAAQLEAEVILIEERGVGGNAVLTDVVPSKTLIATAEAAQRVAVAQSLGLEFSVEGKRVNPHVEVDLKTLNKRLLALAQDQSEDMREALVEDGVRIIDGRGQLDGNHHVVVQPSAGGDIEAKTIIVAVGASPRELPDARTDGKRILNWKQLYDLEELPEHMIVVGSGVTGAEFASAYLQLGSKVTLVSSRDKVLPGNDSDAAELIEKVFTSGGMNLLRNARATSVKNTGDAVEVELADGTTLTGSHCLMAVGAIPNTKGLNLEEAGIALNETGHVVVNKVARTSRANVYAIGDCSTSMPLASVSAMMGRTAVYHTLGDVATPTRLRNVASNVFTSPEIAQVGWSEQEIRDGLVRGEVATIELETNPRAKMEGISEGFIKLFASVGSGTVIGGVVVAPRASDLIYPIAVAIENRLTVDQLAKTYTVYPSLSGSIAEAASELHPAID